MNFPLFRPYFCYWATIVQIIILIVSVSVYGFASLGIGINEETSADVLQVNLDFTQRFSNVTQNPWGGPSQVSDAGSVLPNISGHIILAIT